jgi:bacterioferritin (cytochrome b1)
MKSYIPRQTKLTRERIEAKLEQSLVRKLEKYTEYLNSDRDYIVSQALEIAFKKDKGFADWLKSETTATPVEEAASQARRGRSE